jgi:hypothetical protein
MQKIVKAHVARSQYAIKLAEKRRQDEAIASFLAGIEEASASKSQRSHALRDEDARENEKRPWLERVKQQAASAEAEKAQKEAMKQAKLAEVSNEPEIVATEYFNGYRVLERNAEFHRMEVEIGPVPKPWKRKKDPRSGRHYFKNTESKITIWVDPRSYDFRQHDPLKTSGDELPYGWDEAETEKGERFYINHTDGSHQREHPRIAMQKQQEQVAKQQEAQNEVADKHLETLKTLRDKKRRLQAMLAEATDEEAVESLRKRIDAIDNAVEREQNELESVKSVMKILMRVLEKQRAQRVRIDPDKAARDAAVKWLAKARRRIAAKHAA